jgi:hypothetical protein
MSRRRTRHVFKSETRELRYRVNLLRIGISARTRSACLTITVSKKPDANRRPRRFGGLSGIGGHGFAAANLRVWTMVSLDNGVFTRLWPSQVLSRGPFSVGYHAFPNRTDERIGPHI